MWLFHSRCEFSILFLFFFFLRSRLESWSVCSVMVYCLTNVTCLLWAVVDCAAFCQWLVIKICLHVARTFSEFQSFLVWYLKPSLNLVPQLGFSKIVSKIFHCSNGLNRVCFALGPPLITFGLSFWSCCLYIISVKVYLGGWLGIYTASYPYFILWFSMLIEAFALESTRYLDFHSWL